MKISLYKFLIERIILKKISFRFQQKKKKKFIRFFLEYFNNLNFYLY
jgi:hypothetical protein